jgi:hypothetical protein
MSRITILNLPIAVFLIGCMVYTIAEYPTLSKGEGWGLIGMVYLFVIGISGFFADIVLHNVIKSEKRRTGTRVAVLIAYTVVIVGILYGVR